MSSDKLNYGRIFLAIAVTFAVGIILMFGLQICVLMPKMMDVVNDIDPNADSETQQDQLQERWTEVMDDYLDESGSGSSTLNVITIVDGVITALVGFFLSFRTARRWSSTPQQAIRYGLLIGGGITISFGVCVVCSLTSLPVRVIVLGLLFAGGFFGGQFASQNLALGARPNLVPGTVRSTLGGLPPASPFNTPYTGLPSVPGAGAPAPDVYYTMGVQAALGGRREEAQQHFKHVLQGNPRHVAAWLQLANLATSPEEAWNYIQQARSIDASDPAVVQAVSVIWPQVAARAQQSPPPQPPAAQPPAAQPPTDSEPPAES